MDREKNLEEKILNSFDELVQEIKDKKQKVDINLIKKAFDLICKACRKWEKAFNKTGCCPPIEIAKIIVDLGMGTQSIITALLYDIIGSKGVTYQDVKDSFGEKIADMVQSIAKLSYVENKMPFFNQDEKKPENYENLLCAVSKDIRVLIIKLADRLHNMRVLKHNPNINQRKSIASETLKIYAALAERIGIRDFKEELQDLSFIELYPERRREVVNQIDILNKGHKNFIKNMQNNLEDILSKSNVGFVEISGREKKPYSIWKKLQNKKISFQNVFDVFAFRIVTKSQDDCYRVLSIIHDRYSYVPEEFKDHIGTSKSNGYQSLHTVVITPTGQRIEIQIRTEEMHRTAEFGSAAHWKYKNSIMNTDNKKSLMWIDEILSIIQNSYTASETIANFKLAISYHQVFCFTPKGKLITLSKGATVLDFGFYVNLNIALRCIGGIINGRNVPMWHQLKDGDIVEIICSNEYTASEAWNKILYTGKARAELSRYLNSRDVVTEKD